MAVQPPKFAQRLLHWFCPADLVEGIEGDILEQYSEDLKNRGPSRAKWNFIYQVFRFFRQEIISRNKFSTMTNLGLLQSHIKISLRNIKRQFSYSLINLFGLALGIASCLLIYQYTFHQLHFDQFHRHADQLYRVNQTAIWDPAGGQMASTPPPLAKQLQENIPEIISTMRINTPGNSEVRYEHPKRGLLAFRETDILAADSNFFSFFNVPLISGDPKTALVGQNRVVITLEMAEKYFQSTNVIGKTLHFAQGEVPTVVSGVAAPLPSNMHFDFDFLLSMPSNPNVAQFDWSWIWTQIATYAKIQKEVDVEILGQRATEALNPQIRATMDRIGMDYDDFMKDKGTWGFTFQPVTDIHLYSTELGNRIGAIGNIKTIRILQILAFLILFMAIVNFVNLSTARAATRSKEVGVKKTMGAPNRSLAWQFQVESLTMTFLAGMLAIPILLGFSRVIKDKTNITLELGQLISLQHLPILLLVLIGVGFLAGIYPSFYLTSFKPSNILAKRGGTGLSDVRLRNILVTTQFAISLALLSGSLMVGKQLNFLKEKDLGFDRENLLVINHAESLGQQIESFRSALQQLPNCQYASITMDVPGRGSWEDIFMREGSDIKLPISQVKIDPYFFPAMQFELKAGRSFEHDRKGDEEHAILNETSAKLFGWTAEEALGKNIIYPGLNPSEIIGVVNDFHFQSLYTDIRPLVFFHHNSVMWGDQRVVVVKYQAAQLPNLIVSVQSLWKQFSNDSPFEYSILDEELDQLYEEDRRLSNFVKLLTYLSIIIALLGLVGLIAYATEQRKKEIGIRKVLGAGGGSIFMLINQKYLVLIGLSLLLAVPMTILAMNSWLEDFAYRMSIPWHIFPLAAGLMILLSLASVGILIFRATRVNPAEVLQDQ